MDTSNPKINVLIVGATGRLGIAVTKHCIQQSSLIVNILVRDPQKNKELTNQVTEAGGKVIQGDLAKPETLKGITKGMHTVIMTFSSLDAEVMVDGQIAIINDAIENKVERIVPAEFSTNQYKFSREELQDNVIKLSKIKVQDYLKTVPIKCLNIYTGILLDWYFDNVFSRGFTCWGEPDRKLQYTSYDDTGKVVAAAVAKRDRVGDVVFVSEEISTRDLVELYNRVRGTDLKVKKLGSMEELRALIEEMKKKGDPNAVWLQLSEFVYDDRGNFDKVDNAEFEEVKKTSVEEFLKQNPNVRVEV